MKKISVILISIIFGPTGCHNGNIITCKDCDEFSCLVNGDKFLPSGPWKSTTLASQTFNSNKAFTVYANNERQYISIFLRADSIIKPGVYELTDFATKSSGLYLDKITNKEYQTSPNVKGIVTLTTVEYGNLPLAKGTFSFRATYQNGREVVDIAEGTFSVHFTRN